jgi:hypothetical protein
VGGAARLAAALPRSLADLLALLHPPITPTMSLDHRLIDLLVCPVCKGPLQMLRDAEQRPPTWPARPTGWPFPSATASR